MAVETILKQLDIAFTSVELGKTTLAQQPDLGQLKSLNTALKAYGLELMTGKKNILTENIRILINELFHGSEDLLNLKFSQYLSSALGYDYTYLANIFSEVEGSTIERFYIVSRTERVKELIVYEDLSLKEIAYKLNYSSVSHLCVQFKKVTGHTPSEFKRLCDTENFVWRKV